MKGLRAAAAAMALTAVVGSCSGSILHRYGSTESVAATVPGLAAASDAVVARTRHSVVKVHGESESCFTVLEGSGFVVTPHRVMTNAHVVAGAESFSVDADGKTYAAQVVSYDPHDDIAILDVPDLAAPPLRFADYTAGVGTDALVLGFPGAASFTASPARIRAVTDLNGPDIYHTTSVTRQVYVLAGSFTKSGGSGSAVVDLSGNVLGVYFGAESSSWTTGFAMTADQVAPQMAKARNVEATDTGSCVS